MLATFIHPFIGTDLVAMSYEWLEQSSWNLQEYSLAPTYDLMKSKVKMTADHWGG